VNILYHREQKSKGKKADKNNVLSFTTADTWDIILWNIDYWGIGKGVTFG